MNIWKDYEIQIKDLNAKMFNTPSYGTRRQIKIIFDNSVLKVGDIYDIYIINIGITLIAMIIDVHPDEIEIEFYRHGEKHHETYSVEDIKILLKHTPIDYIDTKNPPYGEKVKFHFYNDNTNKEEK